MKLIEFTYRFPDQESCELHLKQEREKAGVIAVIVTARITIWNKCWMQKMRSSHHAVLRNGNA